MTRPLPQLDIQQMFPNTDFGRMFTIAETADLIGYSQWQTRKLYRQGLLRGYKAPTATGVAAKNAKTMIFGQSIKQFIEQGIRNAQA